VRPPAAGKGRPKGALNKTTRELKDMILEALHNKGGAEYLERQADENPSAFLTLVGKVLPLNVQGRHDIAVASIDAEELRKQAKAEVEDLFGEGAMGPLIEPK
jgi:hypothetical protein